jgi:rRNA maturation endonuclease Nob1
MNRWASEHPEEYSEIASLPLSQQNDALRHAVGYDPDAIRDQLEEDDHLPPSWSRCATCKASYRNPELTGMCPLCGGRPKFFVREEQE